MSLVDAQAPETAGPEPQPQPERWTTRRGAMARLVGAELRLVLGRRRNQVLIGGLGLVPLMVGLVLHFASHTRAGAQGPGFVAQATQNGLFLVVSALFMCLPALLPITVAIVSGDAVAGEAGTGTLRYLLLLPVGRTRLLVAKAVGALTLVAAAVAVIAVVGLVAGSALFGLHDVVLLSGTTVSLGDGILRVLGVVVYIGLSMTGLVAVGLFFSTLTETPIAAMAATFATAIVSTVLDSLTALASIQPYLLTHYWYSFAEFLRLEVGWGTIGKGLAVQLAWIAIFGSLAWSRFYHSDVTS